MITYEWRMTIRNIVLLGCPTEMQLLRRAPCIFMNLTDFISAAGFALHKKKCHSVALPKKSHVADASSFYICTQELQILCNEETITAGKVCPKFQTNLTRSFATHSDLSIEMQDKIYKSKVLRDI